MATKVQETALATTSESMPELSPTGAAAAKQFEIQSAIIIARKFPRDEETARKKFMAVCGRASFAEDSMYSFPRGGKEITGPSVHFAREFARLWGNLRFGVEIIRDDDDTRQIRPFAWDVETNTLVYADDSFSKKIQRNGQWKKTDDERELRELTNRHGSIGIRNCLLQLLPKDMTEDALNKCKKTLGRGIKADPTGAHSRILRAFKEIGVTESELETYLDHELDSSTPDEIADLRGIYKSIIDGNAQKNEFFGTRQRETGTVNLTNIRPGTEPNRGHNRENLDKVGNGRKSSQPRLDYAEGSDPDPFLERDPGQEG